MTEGYSRSALVADCPRARYLLSIKKPKPKDPPIALRLCTIRWRHLHIRKPRSKNAPKSFTQGEDGWHHHALKFRDQTVIHYHRGVHHAAIFFQSKRPWTQYSCCSSGQKLSFLLVRTMTALPSSMLVATFSTLLLI